jgi:hypothetical protein
MARALILLAVAILALTSCGTPGAPQPPSLWLPVPPDDLTATRKGNKVTLSWTMPRETTDNESITPKHLGPTKICRGLANPLTFCTDAQNVPPNAGKFVGQLSPDQTPIPQQEHGAPKLTFTDTIPLDLQRGHETEFANYAVQIFNSNRRAATPSNQVRVPLAIALSAPLVLNARVDANQVIVAWTTPTLPQPVPGVQFSMVVQRRDDSGTWTRFNEGMYRTSREGGLRNAYEDHAFAWETTYFYKITPITRVMKDGKVIAEVEGDDSPEIKVFTKDIFPPAQPSGVQAVFSGTGQKPFIDITWAPNTDEDLAGYNIFRHEQGGVPQKLNTKLILSPSFRDDNVQVGHTYNYSVSAVDLRNNESPRSEETSETVPK